ncbi:MAG: histidine kinase [Candidatus Niameybacter stercoravium]|nr:histidine kinase [Candidatus Niameybacter stercoravium]
MKKVRKVKLAYKVIGTYLFSHFIIALSIVAVMGVGIQTIQENFIQRYTNNATQHMEYFDEELLSLQNLLMYTMQSKSILVLADQYEQLSDYNKVSWKKQVMDDLLKIDSQYKWISDIGIYISKCDLWITSLNWFRPDDLIEKLNEKEGMYFLGDTLYLLKSYENQRGYRKGYIKLNQQELVRLIEKIRFNEEVYIEVLLNGEQLEIIPPNKQEENKLFTEIVVKSKLYPIEFRIHIPNQLIDFGNYFYTFSILSLILLCVITIKFSKYLNTAIHRPLQHVLENIENMNTNNFKEEIKHEGIDEFEYVTESFNKTKGLLESYIKKNYEQEINMKQIELSHLQGQIKPHFLYNCFFNIANMCKTYDVDKIEQLTLGLAKYYRYITRTNHEFVKLEEEYEHMKNYIYVQQIRFEDRVEIEIDALPGEVASLCVPRLILQPVVENAYKYVFEKIEEGGKLHIRVKQQDASVLIQVEDNGQFIELEQINSLRERIQKGKAPITGLMNIQKRLSYLHEKNNIIVAQGELGGLAITLQIWIKD